MAESGTGFAAGSLSAKRCQRDGKLLYRRVLLHSHVDEKPFTRSGGPVPIQADTVVWVRAHMNTSGYGGMAFKGSVKTGFKQAVPDVGFAAGLAKQAPLRMGVIFDHACAGSVFRENRPVLWQVDCIRLCRILVLIC